MDPNRLLVVGRATTLSKHLGDKGYSVETCDRTEGIERAISDEYAVVLIDAPDGCELLRQIREVTMVPVLMLMQRDCTHEDCIRGLEAGADDCLLPPFDPRELVARLRSIQRRAGRIWPPGEEPTGELITVGDVELDTAARRAKRGGQPLPLTGVEFTLLETLVRAAGRVLSREALTRQVLRRKFSPFDRSIDVHISSLRKKLGPDGPERIRTQRGEGYLYAPPGD